MDVGFTILNEFRKAEAKKSDYHVRAFVFWAVADLSVVESIDISDVGQDIIVRQVLNKFGSTLSFLQAFIVVIG